MRQDQEQTTKPAALLKGESFLNFLDGMKAKASRRTYTQALGYYCQFTKLDTDSLIVIAKKDTHTAIDQVKSYLRFLKARVEERKDLQPATVALYYYAPRLFYEMNDIAMNWTKLQKMLPEQSTLEDRAYTKEEINLLLKHADVREKVIILLLATAGLRIGALPDLQLKHLQALYSKKKTLLAGLLTAIYPDTNEEYFAFITPECYNAIQEYIKYRERNHEKIIEDAPLIRNVIRQGVPTNASRTARQMHVSGLQWAVWRLLVRSGVRKLSDRKRYDVKMDQGFRKFFNTMCKKAKVDVTHKEMFMGHTIGLDDSYYRPEPEDLLPDYMKVVPFITFDDAEVLKVQNLKLSKELNKKEEEQELRLQNLEKDNAELKRDNALFMKEWKANTEEMHSKKRTECIN